MCKRNRCCDRLDDEAIVTHIARPNSDPRRHPLSPGSSGNRSAIAEFFGKQRLTARVVSAATTTFSTAVRIWIRQRADWAFVGFKFVVGLLHSVFQPPVASLGLASRPSKLSTENHAVRQHPVRTFHEYNVDCSPDIAILWTRINHFIPIHVEMLGMY